MSWRKFFNLTFAAVFLLSLLPAIGLAQEDGTTPTATAEIEADLLDVLNTEGTANYFAFMAEKADLSAAYEIDDWDARGWYVYNTLREVADRSQAPVVAYAKEHGLDYQTFFGANAVYFRGGDLETALDLAALPGVERLALEGVSYITPDLETPPGTDTYGWNLDTLDPASNLYGMEAAQVWAQYGVKGDGIVVANQDTGAYYQHNALVRQYRGNLGGGSFQHNYNWWDPTNTYPNAPGDGHGHGSGTIGIMAGETADLTEQIGVAPEAQWIACKGCTDGGSCPDSYTFSCGDFFVAPWDLSGQNPDPAKRPHIINNSWGGPGCSTSYQPYNQAWVAAGMFPAWSAGNTVGCGTVGSPGDNPEAFGTAAHSSTGGNLYAGGPSCHFPNPSCDPDAHEVDPHLNAPTFGRTADNCQDCYYNLSGTSGASPHTAGTVALIWSGNPGYIGDVPGTFTVLEQSADPNVPAGGCGEPACAVDHVPNYEYGWGYLDALAAVTMAGVGGQGALNGTVTEVGTGTPLADITVFAERLGGGTKTTTTDASGYYTTTLTSGAYTVTASGPQHTASTVTGVVITTGTVTLQNFSLDPKGLLYGYVTDADSGAPLEATVTADGMSDMTDPATGYYSMYLDAGTYDVMAEATDYASQTVQITINADQQLQQDFALQAAIAVVPDPIALSLELGQTGSASAVMTNNMVVDYPFMFIEVPGAMAQAAGAPPRSAAIDVEPEAEFKDPTPLPAVQGTARPEGTGGPDAFGYTYKDNFEPDGPQYNFVDISATGTPVYLGDDDSDGPFDVGFTFNFYGIDYTQFWIWSNGTINFDDAYTSLTNQCPLPAASYNNLIATMWDDLDPGDTGDAVYYESFSPCPYPGAGSCLIVQYDNFHHYPGGGLIAGTWEAILFDNGNVLIQFLDVGAEAGSGSTTGIENADGTIGLTYACNTPGSLSNESAICFNYPGAPPCGGGDIPWFATSIVSGTVPAGTDLEWTNYFSATAAAGIDQPGVYEGNLMIVPNPAQRQGLPTKNVPVELTVTAPATWGKIEGTVTSDRPGGPLEAEILIEDGMGMTWTVTTDPDTGFYEYWLNAGAYDVTASAPDYVPETAQVQITAGQTTTQDFELELDAPWIDVTPTSLETTLDFGDTDLQTFTISNLSNWQPLDWEVSEVDNGFTPLAQCEEFYGGDLSSVWSGGTRDRGNLFEATEDTVISGIYAYLNFAATTDVYYIVYEGSALTGTYNKIFELQNPAAPPGAQWHFSGPIAVPVQAGMFYYVGASWNGTANYYRAGTNITPYATNCFGILQTGNPGTLAGYPPGPSFSNTYGSGYIADYGFGIVTGGGDVPWLMADPISGTIAANGNQLVDVTFDAGQVPEPGIYMADLRIGHNDPLNDDVTVMVTMTVQPTADIGKLEGTVTSDRPGGPLEAEILIEDSAGMTWTVATDPDTGYYYRWLSVGFYTVTASADGYLPETVTDVEIVGQGTTTQDFELVLNQPEIAVSPLSMEETLVFGDQATQTLNIENIGVAPLNWDITEQDRGMIPSISIPRFEGTLPDDGAPVSFEQAPGATGSLAGPTGVVINGAPAFAVNLFDDSLYDIPDLDFPGTWGLVGATGIGSAYCGDFAFGDFSTLYIINNDAPQQLYAVDTATGSSTLIGPSPSLSGQTWTGMSFDPVTGVMYGSATDGATATLFTIDLGTGATTQVGTIAGFPLTIDIAVSPAGQMYGVDIGTDELITIDKNTGAASAVGSTGFSANYAQGLDFDDDSGILYWAAYSASGELRIIDTTTGNSTLVGAFAGGAEVDSFAVATGGGGDVLWLSEVPASGTVPPFDATTSEITFDSSAVSEPGTYLANLNVNSDDPYNGRVTVAVTMTVLPSGDIGKLEGYVMGLGYCDADSYPAEAEIVIESSTGMTWTTTSDPATGYYYRWLNEDSYTLYVSAPEHVPDQAAVQVTAGQTTTQDFDLRYVESCMDYTPPAFDLTITEDTQLTETLSIINDGAGELMWELHETTRTVTAVSIPPFEGTLPQDGAPASTDRAPGASAPGDEAVGILPWLLAGEPAYALDVYPGYSLVYIPDTTVPGTWNIIASVPQFHPAADFLNGDFSTLYALDYDTNQFVTIDTTTGARTVIGSAIGNGNWSGMTGATDGTLYASSSVCGTSSTLYTVDPATGALTIVGDIGAGTCIIDIAINAQGQMYGVDIVSDVLMQIDPATGAGTVVGSLGVSANYAQGMDFEEDTGILYWAAYIASGELRIIDTATGASTLVGAFPGGNEVDGLAFATGGGGGMWTDVPWVSEVPTNGVTAPDSAFDVDVIFDSTGLTVGECYTANLGLIHDDPGWDETLYIPLRLCVEECIEMTGMELSVLTTDPIVGEPVQFQVDMSPANMSMPYDYTIDFGDDTQVSGSSLDATHYFSHTYTGEGDYTVEFGAMNCGMTEPMIDTVEVMVSAAVSRYYLPIVVKNY